MGKGLGKAQQEVMEALRRLDTQEGRGHYQVAAVANEVRIMRGLPVGEELEEIKRKRKAEKAEDDKANELEFRAKMAAAKRQVASERALADIVKECDPAASLELLQRAKLLDHYVWMTTDLRGYNTRRKERASKYTGRLPDAHERDFAANAGINRSLITLGKRGLVEHTYGGKGYSCVRLTDAGREWLKARRAAA